MFHCTVTAVVDIILLLHQGKKVTTEVVIVMVFLSLLNWVRDDMTLYLYFDEGQDDKNRKQGKRMQLLSNGSKLPSIVERVLNDSRSSGARSSLDRGHYVAFLGEPVNFCSAFFNP